MQSRVFASLRNIPSRQPFETPSACVHISKWFLFQVRKISDVNNCFTEIIDFGESCRNETNITSNELNLISYIKAIQVHKINFCLSIWFPFVLFFTEIITSVVTVD